jgi:hypothetical protein
VYQLNRRCHVFPQTIGGHLELSAFIERGLKNAGKELPHADKRWKKSAPGEGNDVKRIDGFATSENTLRW